jgi:translation initiation factor 2B subunit (eIF-2B alpha/beta/delta family)
MLLNLLDQESEHTPEELTTLLRDVGLTIIASQSGMAALITLFNRLFSSFTAAEGDTTLLSRLQHTLQSFCEEQGRIGDTIYRKAAALIPSAATIMTHSASSTVLRTLIYANEQGRKVRVFAMEGRPLYEGRLLAKGLADAGLDTISIIDGAAYVNLSDTELVLLGADSMSQAGVVSKIGTAGLAACAQSLGIPLYFLAETTKLWPSQLGRQPVHKRAASDVWTDAPNNLTVQNRFYDTTLWSTVSGIVTEDGLSSPESICAACDKIAVHPWMHSLVAEVRSTI